MTRDGATGEIRTHSPVDGNHEFTHMNFSRDIRQSPLKDGQDSHLRHERKILVSLSMWTLVAEVGLEPTTYSI